jgi:hypothetical protein
MHATIPNHSIHARVPTATLPTGRFLLGIFGIGAAVALGWWGVTWLLGLPADQQWMGTIAVAVVVGCATIALLAVRPWKRRSMLQLPFIWLGSSVLRMVAVLFVSILLYFAFSLDIVSLLIAVVVAYLATLAGETLIYVQSVRVLPPVNSGMTEGDR